MIPAFLEFNEKGERFETKKYKNLKDNFRSRPHGHVTCAVTQGSALKGLQTWFN